MNQQSPDFGAGSRAPESIPSVIPVIPVVDVALFPKMQLPLMVSQPELIQLVDEVMNKERIIGILAAKGGEPEKKHKPEDLYDVGTAALILKMAKASRYKAQLLVQGLARFKAEEFMTGKPYLRAKVSMLEETGVKDMEVEALVSNLIRLFGRMVEISPYLPHEMAEWVKTLDQPGLLADVIASTLQASLEDKQLVLETLDVKKRLREVTRLATHQVEVLELERKIQSQVKGEVDKSQRDFYLRQQLKAIQEELGERDESGALVEEYRQKLEEANLPEEARQEAERELDRLSRMHPSSSEYTVATTYLDWMVSLPWNKSTEDVLDIKEAAKILDEDHYDLEKPKRRILEYLSVKKIKPDSRTPILCFAGPPGTGKTSLGKSIARTMGRKFVRMSLGGVRDEAEIRGHRRTYVGALPGRIIQGLKRAGSNNPVFMLDEIDKLGADFRGDPSSALLEVLDPEQNYSFVDHYIDVPFDLTKVLFVTTANVLDTIPPALRDRMEVIMLSGYTQEEKVKIAKRYLIPRQRDNHGLSTRHIRFTDSGIKHIISGYTREAGLRNLEREIASVCRGVARDLAESEEPWDKPEVISAESVSRFLGPVRFASEIPKGKLSPGVAIGLAWTQAGGEILFVESSAMAGKKNLILTGQMGDVMKESATAAMSFLRSHAKELGIDETFFDQHDVHIHVPAGAIPKDGPSAGVAMLTALASLAKNKPAKKGLAMTGEITLRGQVLPVGGVKEKVLAAKRAGIKEVILPKWNEKDLEDIPKEVQKKIAFHFVDRMDEALEISLGK
ncbi:MAG: endopeptidase La [Deltaproteobacteria bacterium]|nr:endopeptidase La [Deltaproteobacteria bacterium]